MNRRTFFEINQLKKKFIKKGDYNMRKAKSTISRLLTVALVLVMVLSMSVTAFAAGLPKGTDSAAIDGYDYTIKINPNENTTKPDATDSKSVSGRYHAYQIFAGTVGTPFDDTDTPREDGGSKVKDPATNNLSDITWGVGMKDNAQAFVEALLKDEKMAQSLHDYLAGLKDKTGENDKYTITGDKTNGWKLGTDEYATCAADIADWLAKNPGFVRDFSDVAGKHVVADNYFESEWKDTKWEIGKVPGGYYLIKDTYTEDTVTDEDGNVKGGANSEFIVTVVGDAEVYVKSDAPTSKKEIEPPTDNANGNDGSGNANGDVAGVGDHVTFVLTGTLPENYSEYDAYKYKFRDTMSKGLTYDDNAKVYVKIGNDYYLIDPAEDATGYKVTKGTSGESSTLNVEFTDLTKVVKGKKVTNPTDPKSEWKTAEEATPINIAYQTDVCPEGTHDGEGTITHTYAKTEIYVVYTATVNNKAEFKNDNKSDLEYSNNPEDGGEGTGHTPEDEVYVYTFGLDNHKTGVGTPDDQGLGGAGFAVSKKVTEPNPAHTPEGPGAEEPETIEKTYYAYFEKGKVTVPNPEYKPDEQPAKPETIQVDGYILKGWISEADLLNTLGKTTIAEITKEEWAKQQTAGVLNGYWLVAESAATTGDFLIWGLDEGVYTLSEKVTPNGYNTMDDFDITIKAEVDTDGTLKEESKAESSNENPSVNDDHMTDDGWIELELKNTKTLLPGTGGIGTTIFQVSGIVLLVGAAIYLFVSSSKKREAR